MDGDQWLTPLPQHVRNSSWGGPEAGAELGRICFDARRRAGFKVASLDVLRPDGFLEAVAFSGGPEGDPTAGGSFSLALARRVLREGTAYGKFVFLREEDMAPDLQEAVRGYGYVPELPKTDDPWRWRSLDMLMAHLTDSTGRTRALFHLDEPVDGIRPSPEGLAQIADDLELLLQAVITAVDREELTRYARLDDTAREIVRAGSGRLGQSEFLEVVNPRLVAGFRASGAVVHLYDDSTGEAEAAGLGADLISALEAATRRAWGSRTVIVVEPDHVWGDEELHRHHRVALGGYLGDVSAKELIVVPIGAGHEAMGMLVIVRDGRDRWTENESLSALGVGHDLGRALLSTRAHEREHQLISELQQLDDYRRQLIATVAHELKSPIGVIAGHVELLDQLPGVPASASASLQALTLSATRLDTVVRDLLLVGRIGNPETPVGRVPVHLGDVLATVIGDEAARAAEHKVTIRSEVDDDVVVHGDPEELRQMLANLLSNAVKYSHRHGVVDLTLRREVDQVVFRCSDHGPGVSRRDRSHLFDEFFRSLDPVARQRLGTGLGLAIVARIVGRHEGRVDVDSELGGGSTFTVTLPAAKKSREV
jgi:two-component system phosphate regulon sensor histidine kinase PhoR